VLRYLARYTHRVAISNRRLVARDDKGVTFTWKDYRLEDDERYKVMTLDSNEFIRRFLMHVLPQGFHRIRLIHLILLIFSSLRDFYARFYARFSRRMRADGSGQRRCPERGLRRERVGLISAAAKQGASTCFRALP
jgi:hypothetical protein